MKIEEMNRIAGEYGFKVFRDTCNCQRNCGASASDIMLGDFDNPKWEETAFWHELGHLVNGKNNLSKYCLCCVSNEGAAWETAFNLAEQHGRHFEHDSEERAWARKQLETYRRNDDNWR